MQEQGAASLKAGRPATKAVIHIRLGRLGSALLEPPEQLHALVFALALPGLFFFCAAAMGVRPFFSSPDTTADLCGNRAGALPLPGLGFFFELGVRGLAIEDDPN
jgi:hypothetical protein